MKKILNSYKRRQKGLKRVNKKELILGAAGALFMMMGDLALSIVTPDNADEGLFLREAYLSGSWELWRGLFILVTGVLGIYGYSYGMKGIRKSLDPGYRRTEIVFDIGTKLYLFTGLTIHFAIGVGAYLTSYLGANYGRELAIQTVSDYWEQFAPGFALTYLGMAAVFVSHSVMLLFDKTVYSKKMIGFSPLLWMLVMAIISDIGQVLDSNKYAWEYMVSQTSGNAGPFIWFMACLFLPDDFKYNRKEQKSKGRRCA